MQTGRTGYNEYDDKSHDVKGEVTEYVLPKYIPNLHNGVFVGLPGKTPVDLPLLYRHGIIDDTTIVECVYDPEKADMKGRWDLKRVSFEVNLKRHLKRNGVGDAFIGKCLNFHYSDIRYYFPGKFPDGRKIGAMYIDTCNEYYAEFPLWLNEVDDSIESGAAVLFNFSFIFGNPKIALPKNPRTTCPFRMFNMKDGMERIRRQELSMAANDFLGVLDYKGNHKYELLELVSYRNNQTEDNRNPCRMGIMVFRKK